MNNTKKLHLNMRNKLMAAVAMLLVASIMMVSTTYAWFTLSTAPEVQGITTTVGANGNLEIALAPTSGNADEITSAMGDSQKDWTAKNITWGNLLNLEDASYKLSEITLLPARLNYANGVVGSSPLATPVYGADGRISALDNNTNVGIYSADDQGFVVDAAKRGVRAVGTSSSMTPEQLSFFNSLSSLSNHMSNTQNKAEASLNANGSKLAEMAINHVNAGEGDSSDYKAYLATLSAVLTTLGEANDELDQAIRSALMATASSGLSNQTAYALAKSTIVDTSTLEEIWTTMTGSISIAADNALAISYNNWASIKADLANAATALAAAQAKADNGETVLWSDVSTIMSYVMNTTGITINGKSLGEFKTLVSNGTASTKPEGLEDDEWTAAQQFVSSLMGGVTLELGNGSGIYADFGAVVGNLNAGVTLDQLSYGTLTLRFVKATIATVTEPNNGAYLFQVNYALQSADALSSDASNAANVIDVTYGYMVDFFFRTNASGSNLLLQTDGTQRVYTDSSNTDTLGGGSKMTFRTGTLDVVAVKGLMECVRVVFMNPDTLDIYGIGALDMATATQKEIAAATEGTDAIVDVTASLYLYNYSTNASGALVLGTALTDTTGKTADTQDDAVLCALSANTAQAVSAMVYLDGDNVDNADVANAASSMTGTLNLQFASSATLVPMENSALKNATGSTKYNVTVLPTNVENAEVNAPSTATQGQDYTFTVTPDEGYTATVTITVGGETAPLAPTSGNTYTIPAAGVLSDFTINVTTAAVVVGE